LNTERVLCPVIYRATRSGTPAARQIANGGPPQVMRNAPLKARLRTRCPERFDEGRDSLALHLPVRAVEHPGTDHAFGFQSVVFDLLSFEETLKDVGEREGPAFVVLRRVRVQADDATFEVDMAPPELQHLARDAPAGDVGELNRRPNRRWQMSEDSVDLLALEEARSYVPLLEHRDVRHVGDDTQRAQFSATVEEGRADRGFGEKGALRSPRISTTGLDHHRIRATVDPTGVPMSLLTEY